MKTSIITFFSILLGLSCASCQDKYSVMVTLIVTDDAGKPVNGSAIETDVFDYWKPGESFGQDIHKRFKLVADESGTAILNTSSSRCDLVFLATKTGYYAGSSGFKSTKHHNDRWEPWNPTVKIELRRVLNPIRLMAKKVCEGYGQLAALPADSAGYDLEIGDWTAPHGKGKVADIKFHLQGRTNDTGTPYESSLKVSFSNASDGLILHESDPAQGSRLRMPYLAPEKGYNPERSWRKARLAGPTAGVNRSIDQIIDETKPTENFFLRVRTRLNEKGEIISAHYAKIQRGFQWGPEGVLKFQYYFNPTPNDRNLEFDPSRNLLNVTRGEKVEEP